MLCVEGGEQSRSGGLGFRGDELSALVWEKVGDGGFVSRVDDGALVLGGEERGVPVFGAVRGEASVIGEDDKGGEIFVQRTQTVTHPCAGTRESGTIESSGLEQGGLGVNA